MGEAPVGTAPALLGACKGVITSRTVSNYFADADGDIAAYSLAPTFDAGEWSLSFDSSSGDLSFAAPEGTDDGTIVEFTVYATDSQGHKSNTITVKLRMTGNCS
jgi:hypothetical protein